MLWWLLLLTIVLGEEEKWREVRISQGPIRGLRDPEGGLYAFYGIPYASTPKGTERFKVLTALSFYATGSYQRPTGNIEGHSMAQQTVSSTIAQVTACLNSTEMRQKYISFPSNDQERNRIKSEFYSKFKIPGVLGCIDCTHVAIVRPVENEERFYCRKHYHSLNVQVAPLPPPTWVEPLEAVNKDIICMQGNPDGVDRTARAMQEDCLIANVYVPDTETKNLQVLVYIHGGAFQAGFAHLLTPKHLVRNKEIIVVTFNYRLGAHGFLCLGTEDVPGNAGLKDQVALLKWVNKNIASFGGNPDDVTIAGYSAGSISAELLMLSKTTDGLFSKVILESGTSVGYIGVQKDPLANAKTFAAMIGYKGKDDVYSLEEFYKSEPLESIMKYTWLYKRGSLLFAPCIEKHNNNVFLDEDPVNIIKQGKYKKVPILIGFSEMEGLLQLEYFEDWKNAMSGSFIDFLPPDLKFNEDEEKYALKIKQFYFKDKAITDDDIILNFIEYYTDILFAYSTLRAVKLHVEAGHTEIYLYEYDFVDEDIPFVPHTEVKGATHCAQTEAVLDGGGFRDRRNESELTEEFREMKEIMRELWTNFVRYGKPVPEGSSLPLWPPANAIRAPYMALNLPLQLRGALLPDRARFWDNIYEKYYDGPKPPATELNTEL